MALNSTQKKVANLQSETLINTNLVKFLKPRILLFWSNLSITEADKASISSSIIEIQTKKIFLLSQSFGLHSILLLRTNSIKDLTLE